MWPFKKEVKKEVFYKVSNITRLTNHPIWKTLGIPYASEDKPAKAAYDLPGVGIELSKSDSPEYIRLRIDFAESLVPIEIKCETIFLYQQGYCTVTDAFAPMKTQINAIEVVSPAVPVSQSEKFFGFVLEVLDKAMESDEEDMDNLIQHWSR